MKIIRLDGPGRIIGPPHSRVLKSGHVVLNPGEEVGEHVTEKREELILIIDGTASITEEGKKFVLCKGEAAYINEGKRHNVINETEKPLRYVYTVAML